LFSLADLKFSANDTVDAASWYQKAADADPSWGKPVYKLGLCALKTGDRESAASLMARVVAIDPVSPEAALAKASLESLKK
jgi:Tfp pilus assembly protein PilF